MRIEVYSAHGGARYWRMLLNRWCEQGHEIVEICAFDDEAYRKPRGAISRLCLRVETYLWFPVRVWFRVAFASCPANTARLVVTSPFFLPWVVVSQPWRRKRCPVINLVNDIYPDALVQARLLRAGALVTRILAFMTRQSTQKSDATVYLGSYLKEYAETRYSKARQARIIAVGADARFLRKAPPPRLQLGDGIGILYSGTMGYMHEVTTIAELLIGKIPTNVHFSFHSSGVGYQMLLSRVAKSPHVSFGGSLSDHEWRTTMNRFPIALVTLRSGAEYVSMPSKTYSALAAGQAILAICAPRSDLADLIRTHDCGWVVAPSDVQALVDLLGMLANDYEIIDQKRRNAYNAAQDLFTIERIAGEYLNLFEDVLSAKRVRAS